MEQYRVTGGRAVTIPGDMGTHYRRSWISSMKVRLSRQTWTILLVMIVIFVAWKSRSVPAKAINKSKQRQEKPALHEDKRIAEEVHREVDEHVFEGTTMESEPPSVDIGEMERLPTVEDQEKLQTRIGVSPPGDDFSTPTTYGISEDMLSIEESKGTSGEVTLPKDGLNKGDVNALNSEDTEDDKYSTPSDFAPLSENTLSSEDSMGKDGKNSLLGLLKSEDSKIENGKYTSEDDKFSTPTEDSKSEGDEYTPSQQSQKKSEETMGREDPTKEDKEDEPSQQFQGNDKEIPTSDDSKKEFDVKAPTAKVQLNGKDVMFSEESKGEEEENTTQQQTMKNYKDSKESNGEDKENTIKQEVKTNDKDNESNGEDKENTTKQEDKSNDKDNKESNEEDKSMILPQQVQKNYKEMMESEDSKGEDEDVLSQQQVKGNNEVIEPLGQSDRSSTECSPHQHIMFLKTHKCASSTVQNILLRYGYQHDLIFALSAGHYLGHPKKFNYNMMSGGLLPPSGKADIFTLHSRLNIPEHQKAMYPDAKWITIVRDPVEQFESLYNYYEMSNFYKMDLASFLNQSVEVLRTVPRWNSKHGRNTMLFDMGYQDTVSPEALDEVIKTMDNLFHYVMISDRMDESLILLRNELCWTNHDVIGFTKNARIKENKTLSDEQANKISQMNMEDTAIYNHFLNKHIQLVKQYGIDKMAEEVSELQKLRQSYYDFCVAEEVLGHDKRLKGNQEWKPSANAYLPNNSNGTCSQIIMKETNFVSMVRNHQKVLIKRLTKIKK